MNIIEDCEILIGSVWNLLEGIPFGKELLVQLSEMKAKLHQPCVLAIAGKVKAGKSTFLNAILGENLAKVGVLETTATINKFMYGKPEDPNRPVKVIWNDGHETSETLEFMDSLQGNDVETLNKAIDIDHLCYYLEKPILRELTIVDTPGSGAVVSEHEDVVKRFFKLRELHDNQTSRCASEADAIVYLTSAVANVQDKSFLDDFRAGTSTLSPINAIGILAKVDIDMKLLENRNQQAGYIANSLKDNLSTVIPISAGLHEALLSNRNKFEKWQTELKKVSDPDDFKDMLGSDADFVHSDFDEYLSIQDRVRMKEGLPWPIFRIIAHALYIEKNVEDAITTLNSISNIEETKKVINDHFFNRSRIIRCHRTLTDLKILLDKIKFTGRFKLREESLKLENWIKFTALHKEEDLTAYLKSIQNSLIRIEDFDIQLTEIYNHLNRLKSRAEDVDVNYQILQMLIEKPDIFEENELEELKTLFQNVLNINSISMEKVIDRFQYWNGESLVCVDETRKEIINIVIKKYSNILNEKRNG